MMPMVMHRFIPSESLSHSLFLAVTMDFTATSSFVNGGVVVYMYCGFRNSTSMTFFMSYGPASSGQEMLLRMDFAVCISIV